MALGPRLELRQGQSLVMTPQLQQAIKLLQLSNLELTDYVEQELERNPLLEPTNEDGQPDRGEQGDGDSETYLDNASKTEAGGDIEPAPLTVSEDTAPPAPEGDLDTDYDNVYADESKADRANDTAAAEAGPQSSSSDWQSSKTSSGGSFDGEGSFESTLTKELDLKEHLTEQLSVAVSSERERFIGAYLVDQLTEAGYLTETLEESSDRLGVPVEELELLLTKLQTFEPTGVFARDLKECLTLQLIEKDRFDPVMALFLENLELFARRELSKLLKICDIDEEDLTSLLEDVRSCDPKPGHAFGAEPIQPIVPDVFVRNKIDGGWAIELNTETLPRVLVNSQYYAEVASRSRDKETKTYLTDCLANANWLVKSLDQRARTILKVSTEIVRQQDGFLTHGVSHLRPLNLKTVADAISMHESTVSRVTSNKYMGTTRGIFELKYFFSSSIASTSGGDAYSAESVRHRIKDLIAQEDAKKILSDDRIVALLKDEGIDIARRTVAKYREALNIPSSVQRRREKKAFA